MIYKKWKKRKNSRILNEDGGQIPERPAEEVPEAYAAIGEDEEEEG